MNKILHTFDTYQKHQCDNVGKILDLFVENFEQIWLNIEMQSSQDMSRQSFMYTWFVWIPYQMPELCCP